MEGWHCCTVLDMQWPREPSRELGHSAVFPLVLRRLLVAQWCGQLRVSVLEVNGSIPARSPVETILLESCTTYLPRAGHLGR